MDKPIEEIFRKDRLWVKLQNPIKGQKVIPKAVYTWLSGNPSFKEIPIGVGENKG